MLVQKAFSACEPDIQLWTGNFGVQFVSNMKKNKTTNITYLSLVYLYVPDSNFQTIW